MPYQHYYRTNDPRMPAVHVLVLSDQHVQDLSKHHVCIKHGNLVQADVVYTATNPLPDRWEGHVFHPAEESNRPQKTFGNALVFCFETESQMHAFCQESGAIEGTLYQQDSTPERTMTKLYFEDKKLFIPLELWNRAIKDKTSTNAHEVLVAAREAIDRDDAVVVYRESDTAVMLRFDRKSELEDAIFS